MTQETPRRKLVREADYAERLRRRNQAIAGVIFDRAKELNIKQQARIRKGNDDG